MLVSIIVAAADNGVIGNAGGMPWHLPSDLKRFRALTLGKPVIMGRKTFQSLPKALDGRDNIVITRDSGFRPDGAIIAASLEAALLIGRELAEGRGGEEIMVIGGGEIYRQALPVTDRVYLTRVQASPAGDAVFPPLDPAQWRIVREEPLPRGVKDPYGAALIVYERIRAQPSRAIPGL